MDGDAVDGEAVAFARDGAPDAVGSAGADGASVPALPSGANVSSSLVGAGVLTTGLFFGAFVAIVTCGAAPRRVGCADDALRCRTAQEPPHGAHVRDALP
jgi:hypothetical protein